MTQPPAGPADIFHVSRDEAYARQACEEAAFFDHPGMMGIDVESRVTDAYRNEINTGDRDLPWYETIPSYGSFMAPARWWSQIRHHHQAGGAATSVRPPGLRSRDAHAN